MNIIFIFRELFFKFRQLRIKLKFKGNHGYELTWKKWELNYLNNNKFYFPGICRRAFIKENHCQFIKGGCKRQLKLLVEVHC